MDNRTEEGLKRMVQDYEYETTGIPQRLDHAMMLGLERGLAQADMKERQIDMQVDTIVKTTKEVAKKATYESLKKIFFDYEKMYNDAVKHNKKEFGIKRGIKNILGLATLFCIGYPLYIMLGTENGGDGSEMLWMGAFVILGIIWWIFQAASVTWGNPEYSGQARIYQSAMHTILEEGLEKRFKDRFYKDNDFHEYNDMDIFEEDELEEQTIYEVSNNNINKKKIKINKSIIKKPIKIVLAVIFIIILAGIIVSISLNSTLKKANNSQEDIETNSSIENKENGQQNTENKSYIAENSQEFNINALELVKQIISAHNIDIQDDEIQKLFKLNYTQTEENNYIFYTIYRDNYYSKNTMPPFIIVAHKDSGNVFRIAKYLYYTDALTKQTNETASTLLYQYLFTALYSLGQDELVNDITNGKLADMNMTGFIEKLYVSQPGGYELYGFESDNNVIDNITSQAENQSNQSKIENESTSLKNENNNIPSSNNNNNYTNNTNNDKTNTGTNNNFNSNNKSTQNTTIEQIKLPNLVDLTEAEAVKKLESLGLEYSITSNTKQVAFDNPNVGKTIVTNIIDKKDYYSQYDRVQLEVNQYQESGISISFIINTKELVNYVNVYIDNKEYSAYYFPNMSSETFYANGRKSVNIKLVLNNYSENIEIYNKNINLYEANKTVFDNGHTSIDIGIIDYKS